MGIDTNEPPVFYQDFTRTDGKRKSEGPSANHLFGTDSLGRDMFARTLFGGFISFIIGLLATLVASFIGVIYGSVSGYFGGKIDNLMMRFVDILYGLPFLMIIILIKVIADDLKNFKNGGEILGSIILWFLLSVLSIFVISFISASLYRYFTGKFKIPKTLLNIVIFFAIFTGVIALIQMKYVLNTRSEWFGFVLTFVIIGLYAWLTMARIARGQMLEVHSQDYVTAAQAIGASPARIIFKHSIPNILGPVIIYATINIPAVILLEAFLSFLGLGISEPYCSWGTLAKDGFQTLSSLGIDWWMVVFPGGLMAISLFALNFLGDGIRDAIDPKMR